MKPPAFIKKIPGADRKRRGNPEADLQRVVVSTLRQVLPKGFVVHHSANEVRRGGEDGRVAQGIAQGMGVHPGFSDLLVLGSGRCLFLELKSKTGRLSDAQVEFREFVVREGHAWALVRSLDDALKALSDNHFPTRIKGG
jgi:hypothetical protein